uniref:Uncharacterized protein n=1 Tax=Anguilla anguilla TaxID=7936 RepID=A0A0E9USG6_ANGAN
MLGVGVSMRADRFHSLKSSDHKDLNVPSSFIGSYILWR